MGKNELQILSTTDTINLPGGLLRYINTFFFGNSVKLMKKLTELLNTNTHFCRYLNLNLGWSLYIDFHLHRDLYLCHNTYLYRNLYQDLYPDRALNSHRDQSLHIFPNDVHLYLDLYQYVDPYFYRLFSTSNRNQFDEDLLERVTFVERMKQMKIFKKVNLQRMVDRFNFQREFIKTVSKGEIVEPPAEPIQRHMALCFGYHQRHACNFRRRVGQLLSLSPSSRTHHCM